MSAVERTPADAKADAMAGDAKPGKKPRGKLMMIGAAVAVLAAAGGGFFFLKSGPAKPAVEGEEAPAEHAAASGHDKPADSGHGKSEDDGHGGKKKGSSNYFALTPAFVVNLGDTDVTRFLQLDLEVKTHESAAADAITLHMPQIRNALLLLFSQQKFLELETREGKEALQKKVLEEVQHILVAETGKPGVDAVYFTSFVMQ